MSKNDDRILGHADESDGIEEYDNPLPDWWLGLFFVTVVWGTLYAVDYHFISERSQAGDYDLEVARAQEQWPDLDKAADMDTSPETLALGQETFQSTCASCHGANLEGGIGANLVDAEWIHGGTFADVTTTISEGVAAKGMPAWGPILGPKKIAALASFILTEGGGEGPPKSDAPPAPEPAAAPEAAPADGAPAEAPAEAAVELVVTDETVAAGLEVFTTNCVACHAADLTGGVGPNLVDDEWIHGGELTDIARVVTEGVPAKGMITWKGVLTDAQIAQVAAYVYSKSHATE